MVETLVNAAAWFTPEQYLWWTRVQCLAWTSADAVIVFALIRLANAARALLGKRQHLFSLVALGVSLLFAPLVLVASTGAMVFVLELLITIPHFLLILYLLGANHRTLREAISVLRGR